MKGVDDMAIYKPQQVNEVDEVKTEIQDLRAEIVKLVNQIEALTNLEEKKQLRKKEKQLRDKENILLGIWKVREGRRLKPLGAKGSSSSSFSLLIQGHYTVIRGIRIL